MMLPVLGVVDSTFDEVPVPWCLRIDALIMRVVHGLRGIPDAAGVAPKNEAPDQSSNLDPPLNAYDLL